MKHFITKISKKSSPAFDFEDVERMKEYQINLVNTMIYHTPKQNDKDKILAEIKRLEVWLSKSFTDVIHNSNRQVKC